VIAGVVVGHCESVMATLQLAEEEGGTAAFVRVSPHISPHVSTHVSPHITPRSSPRSSPLSSPHSSARLLVCEDGRPRTWDGVGGTVEERPKSGDSSQNGFRNGSTNSHEEGRKVRFVCIGDWGERTSILDAIAEHWTKHVSEFDFVVALGDNFYYSGVAVDEAGTKELWNEIVGPFRHVDRPWYPIVGKLTVDCSYRLWGKSYGI
jgi:hypothetical protein